MVPNVKISQAVKPKLKYAELKHTRERMQEGGYRLICMMPELVNTYNQGQSSEYTLPTTVCCVFERWGAAKGK